MEVRLEFCKFSVRTVFRHFRMRKMSVIVTLMLFFTGIVETNARAFSGTESNQGRPRPQPSCTKKKSVSIILAWMISILGVRREGRV